MIVVHARRHMRRPNRVQTVRLRLNGHPFVGIHLDVRRMGDRGELESIEYSTSSSSFVTRIRRRPSTVFNRSPVTRTNSTGSDDSTCGCFPVPHLATAEEIGDELEAFTVPHKQERARRRLAIEFGDDETARATRPRTRSAGATSACTMPDGQMTRVTSAPARVPGRTPHLTVRLAETHCWSRRVPTSFRRESALSNRRPSDC